MSSALLQWDGTLKLREAKLPVQGHADSHKEVIPPVGCPFWFYRGGGWWWWWSGFRKLRLGSFKTVGKGSERENQMGEG